MTKLCYLCRKSIEEDNVESGDHIVPKQFIKRSQPKAKGFDYAGKLPSHKECNNRFGPKLIAKRQLQ